MKKLLCARISLLTALRRLRSNIGSWISLLLIPALMTGCILLFSKEESSPSAGFAFDTSSPSEQALAFSRLLEEDGFLLMEKEEAAGIGIHRKIGLRLSLSRFLP